MNVEVKDKFLLTIKESAAYFRLGEKKLRALAKEHGERIAVQDGNRVLIKRIAMENFLMSCSVV